MGRKSAGMRVCVPAVSARLATFPLCDSVIVQRSGHDVAKKSRVKPESADRGEVRLKVFISYSHSEVHFADEQEIFLSNSGFEPLIGRHGIDAGENWQKRLGDLILDFSRPGKPTDNAFIEAFNGRFRAECVNQHWFMSLADAREKLEAWRGDYNTISPYSAIGNKPPDNVDESHRRNQPADVRKREKLPHRMRALWGAVHPKAAPHPQTAPAPVEAPPPRKSVPGSSRDRPPGV